MEHRLWLRWLVAISVVALLVRVAFVYFYAAPVDSDLFWNDAVGWNLVQGHGFTASQSEPFTPGIFRSPGYPFFLAAVYGIIGHSVYAALYAQALLDTLSTTLLAMIGVYFLAPRVALLGAALYALYPYAAYYCGVLGQDVVLTFSVMLMVLLMCQALRRDSATRWLCVGLALGATVLVKPFFVLCVAVPTFLIWQMRCASSARLYSWTALMVGLSLMVMPWMARNYLVFHSFPPLAVGGTGTNLLMVLDEVKYGEQAMLDKNIRYDSIEAARRDTETQTAQSGGNRAPVNEDRGQRYLADIGDKDGQRLIDAEKQKTRQFLKEIKMVWPAYALLIVRHIPRLWLSGHALGHNRVVALVSTLISWLVLLPGLFGMWLLRGRWRELAPLYVMVLWITLIYTPYTPEARYTLPARPFMLLFVAMTLIAAFNWLRRSRRDTI